MYSRKIKRSNNHRNQRHDGLDSLYAFVGDLNTMYV